jgi:hypothetical protein
MPLTKDEREFLDAYVYEATTYPFGGPATLDLRQRRIFYNDVHWLLTAYHRELCALGIPAMGKHNPTPPSSPWETLEMAKLRNEKVRDELQRAEGAMVKASQVFVNGPLAPGSDGAVAKR